MYFLEGSALFGTGYNLASAAPTGLILVAGITLPGKGILVIGSTIVTGTALKSPARSCSVGTSVVVVTACRRRVPSYETIPNSLSLPLNSPGRPTGPPATNPN